MRFSFLPAEVKFYDYFEQASANLLEAARILAGLLDDYKDVEEAVGHISELEHRGDFIVHEVTNVLPRTLITPFDAEDIQRLIFSLDDAMDAVDSVAQRLVIYQVSDIKKPARRLAHLILESAQELELAMKGMRDKKTYNEVHARIVQINTLENNGDRVLNDGLSNLVAHRDDIFDFIRWKEIYELLEAATDRVEDVADVLQKVIIANA